MEKHFEESESFPKKQKNCDKADLFQNGNAFQASISNLTYSIKCIQLDQTKQIQDTSFSHLMQNNMIYSSHFESLTVCAKKVIE